MNTITVLVLILGMCGIASAQATQPTTRPAATPPIEFDQFALVILVQGDHPPQMTADAAQKLQADHLGHMQEMARQGKLVVAGPFGNQPDKTWRGMCLYRTSLDEAKQLAERDPAVQAGRLKVIVLTWYVEKGAMTFPIAEKMQTK